MVIKRSALSTFIRRTEGRFFTVIFTKRDGSLRQLNGRLGVTRYLKGGSNNLENYPEYITVYEPAVKSYRTVNTLTTHSLSTGGHVYNVVD